MHSLAVFLLATMLALAIAPAPQSQKKSSPQEKTECGTVVPAGQLEAELAHKAELARKKIAPLAITPPTDAPYHLPLTIHRVRDSQGNQIGLSLEGLDKVMQNLNQMWAQAGIQFFIYGDIDDSIHNDNFYNLPNTQVSWDELRIVNNVPNTINVYFTNLQGGFNGIATFPNESTQGILLDYRFYRGGVLAHEMGHYFNLFHTHETWPDSMGNPTKVECPSGSNCDSAGDLLCDTQADPDLIVSVDDNCNYIGAAAAPAGCDNTPYNPPTRNLMSSSRRFCRTEFTPDQISKILQTLNSANNRKNLITSGARYVNPLAPSSNSKCTYTAPCRTAAKAVSAAQNGDFIFLKPGVHPTSSLSGKQVTLTRWGTAGVAELKP